MLQQVAQMKQMNELQHAVTAFFVFAAQFLEARSTDGVKAAGRRDRVVERERGTECRKRRRFDVRARDDNLNQGS